MTNISYNILIAAPCYSFCEPKTMESIYNLSIPSFINKPKLKFFTGYSIEDARNKAAEMCINEGYDYLLFIDSDIIVPYDLLYELLKLETDVASGWYTKKTLDKIPEVLMINHILQHYEPISLDKLINTVEPLEVDGIGLGCALIKAQTLLENTINTKWFRFVRYENGGTLSEDLDFCTRIKERGAHIKVNPNLHCGHIGQQIYTI
jgi:hypothetical protein